MPMELRGEEVRDSESSGERNWRSLNPLKGVEGLHRRRTDKLQIRFIAERFWESLAQRVKPP